MLSSIDTPVIATTLTPGVLLAIARLADVLPVRPARRRRALHRAIR